MTAPQPIGAGQDCQACGSTEAACFATPMDESCCHLCFDAMGFTHFDPDAKA